MCLKHWPVTLLNRFLDLLMTGEPPVNDTKINNSNRTISHARENNDPHSYCCPGKLKKAQIPAIKPSHLSFNAREYIISACCHMFSPTTNPTVEMITYCTAFRSCSLTRHPPSPITPNTHFTALQVHVCTYIFPIYRVASRECIIPFAFKRATCAQTNLYVTAVWSVHGCALWYIFLASYPLTGFCGCTYWPGSEATKGGFSRRASVQIY